MMNLIPTQDYINEWEARQAARDSIESYMDYMRQTDLPEFQHKPAMHHKLIISKLEQMARVLERNDQSPEALRKFMLSMPPAGAKSTYISVILPTWLMARNPSVKILCVSASDQLSEGFSRARRTIMRTTHWQNVADCSLEKDSQSLKLQKTTKHGELRAASAGATIVGFRCSVLLADDLVASFEQAQSAEQLDKLWHWFLNDARTRLDPSNNVQMIIGTRQSVSDPIGRLLKLRDEGAEHIEYLRLPLICDQTPDPVHRTEGQILWPEHYSPQYVEDAQRSPLIFKTLFQQTPYDAAGLWCPEDKLRASEHAPPKLMTYVIGVDLALTTGGGDFSVISVMGKDEYDRLWLVDLWRQQTTADAVAQAIIRLNNQYDAVSVVCDNDNASKLFSNLLHKMAREQHCYVPWSFLPLANKSKEIRATTLRAALVQDMVKFKQAEYLSDVFNEFISFSASSSGHDDIVDAMALCARQFLRIAAPKGERRVEFEAVQPQIQEIDGKHYTTASFEDLWQTNKSTTNNFAKLRI